MATLIAATATEEGGNRVLLFEESAMNAVLDAEGDDSRVPSIVVAVKRDSEAIAFVRLVDLVAAGDIRESGERPLFAVPAIAMAAVPRVPPPVEEIEVARKTRPLGAMFLDRSAIEDAVRCDADARVEVRRCSGRPSTVVPALRLLGIGCLVSTGDPLWHGCDERAPFPIHSTTEGLLTELSAGGIDGGMESGSQWRSLGKPPLAGVRKQRAASAQSDDDGAGTSSSSAPLPLPAPLALLEKLGDPFGCLCPDVPRLELETGVRYKLRTLLAAIEKFRSRKRRRESDDDGGDVPASSRPTPEAEHAAWQILHGVVLTTKEGCDLRSDVRGAERSLVTAAAGPCEDDAAVAELSKRCRVLALLAERHGGPFSAAQVSGACGIREDALPDRGPPGCLYYRVPFELALDAVGDRRAMLKDGYAYVLAPDVPDVLASVAEELGREVERVGNEKNLGLAFADAAIGHAPELPYHHDAGAMWQGLHSAARQGRLALSVDAAEALRHAPACVHAMVYACSVDHRLSYCQRAEATYCLLDCGFDAYAASQLLGSLMGDDAKRGEREREILAIAHSARNSGPKSSWCGTLQKPWKRTDGNAGPFAQACPYPHIMAKVDETQEDIEAREAVAAPFLSWMAANSGLKDIEDLMMAESVADKEARRHKEGKKDRPKTPYDACRFHAAKLVTPERVPDANDLHISSPSDFLRFVLNSPDQS